MPLETASYIDQLVTTNPVHTDGLSQADAHLRLLKSTLQNQFPNFTAAALTSTQAQLDGAALAVNTNGVAIIADAGAFFKTNTTTGFTNPSTTEVDVKIAGVVVAQFLNTGLTIPGALNVTGATTHTGPVSGPGTLPIGGTIIWWNDTLPTGYGTWAFANGATFPRSNTALYGVLGTTFGAGDGVTTANLPDLRDAVPVGKGTMGATSAIGRITQFVTSILGNFFGESKHQLTVAELASHTPSGSVTTSTANAWTGSFVSNATNGAGTPLPNSETALPGVSTFTGNPIGSDTPHNNVQPSLVCNWIIRTA